MREKMRYKRFRINDVLHEKQTHEYTWNDAQGSIPKAEEESDVARSESNIQSWVPAPREQMTPERRWKQH